MFFGTHVLGPASAHLTPLFMRASVRLHDLRHSFASVGAASGDSLLIIGKLLGHKNAASTQRYAHLGDDPLRSAANRISRQIAAAMGQHEAEVVELKKTPA